MDEFKKWKWSLSPGLPHDAEAAFRAGMAIGEARGRVLGMEESEVMVEGWQVIDYDDTDAKALAALFLEGWETAPGTHESLTDHDDLSYVVLVKRGGGDD